MPNTVIVIKTFQILIAMKRIAVIIAAIAVLVGCSKPTPDPMPMPTPEPTPEPQDVQLVLTYTLDASAGTDMTKSSSADVFEMFYQKMKSGDFIAPSYRITFTEITTGASYIFEGDWGDNDMITIRTGKYRVEGESKANGERIQEQASLKFTEEIDITSSMSSIVLKAQYDCYLLAFAESDIVSMENYFYNGQREQFYKYNGYYYVFSNSHLYAEAYINGAHIKGTREDGSVFYIKTGYAAFEKGKYYIYNDVSGSFELPKMEAGI